MPADNLLLIAYDGSANARAAIDVAAALMPGSSATVLYARQPLESAAAHLEGHPALEDLRGLDAATLDASQRIAEEGAETCTRRWTGCRCTGGLHQPNRCKGHC